MRVFQKLLLDAFGKWALRFLKWKICSRLDMVLPTCRLGIEFNMLPPLICAKIDKSMLYEMVESSSFIVFELNPGILDRLPFPWWNHKILSLITKGRSGRKNLSKNFEISCSQLVTVPGATSKFEQLPGMNTVPECFGFQGEPLSLIFNVSLLEVLRKARGLPNKVIKETTTVQPRSVHITRTEMYNFYFMHCEPRIDGMIISGKSIWKTPSGYLPGRMSPLLNFYGFMSLEFLVLGVFWFSRYARHWKEVLHLKKCITLVITLGMFEMALWYFDWAITFGIDKRTVSRLIILTVLMGYGVVRPTLGDLS
ncbi:transmembrane protein 87A [Tanacetum coccineum]|uniref:Transmembrane protein 87A n=1 Tax=Tanacetum coccineum TaxID=301880 RepID=A0ABQ5DED6_9ASTR